MNNLSSACRNIELVYNNHCYYDPQVIQIHLDVSWNKVDTQPKVSALPGPGSHQFLLTRSLFWHCSSPYMSRNSIRDHSQCQTILTRLCVTAWSMFDTDEHKYLTGIHVCTISDEMLTLKYSQRILCSCSGQATRAASAGWKFLPLTVEL